MSIERSEMKCPLCGCEYDEKEALKICTGCLFAKGCEFVRCPNCFYETIPIENQMSDIPLKREQRDKRSKDDRSE